MHNTEQRLIINIDRNHGVAEKPRRHSIARRPKVLPPALSLEVDLGGVLRRHDPSSSTGRCRSLPRRPENLLGRYMWRRQKAMRRHLPGPPTPDLAKNQGSGGYHPLKQNRSRCFATDISKTPDAKSLVSTHRRPHHPFPGSSIRRQ
jgi:hypothetical protein